MSSTETHSCEFGPFRLDTAERILLRDGCPVPLAPKDYEILLVLVQRSPHIVEKEELMTKVWPDTCVEESNLPLHVFRLRKLLGKDESGHPYIETVPRRGYRFAAKVKRRHLSNLPVPPTPLIGREGEVSALKSLFAQEAVRLVTLIGSGGIGKTHLGIQVAADLIDDFADGVFFVSLASLSDPGPVVSTIAQTLDVREAGGSSLTGSLKQYLRDKRMLLVVDNFEHVVAAAPKIAELLAACPSLKILATSRAPLHVRAEHEFSVPPLALPKPNLQLSIESLSQHASVALFVEQARAVKSDFALTEENASVVAEICRRLDGLPLAIELAAARMKLLTPRSMLAQLEESRLKLLTGGARDLPARQRTMRDAIAWSYDLLSGGEQQLFRRLAVFVGGLTLGAAGAVCDATGDSKSDVLDELESLVDASLVQKEPAEGESRFRVLETIREYALESLAMSGEAEARRRAHAAFFLALAERAEPELTGAGQVGWLERLEQEHGNLRAALQWSKESREVEVGLRLGGALNNFWQMRGHLSEGRGWLQRLLELEESRSVAVAVRAKALYAQGNLAYCHGDYEQSAALLTESLGIQREIGDKRGTASSLDILGEIAYCRGDYELAARLHTESLELRRELNDKWGIAATLNNLGNAALEQGDYERALRLVTEGLTRHQALSDKRGIAVSLIILGGVAYRQGDHAGAAAKFAESLAIRRETGDKWGIATALNNLSAMAYCQGNYQQAAGFLAEGLELRQKLGDKRGLATSLTVLGAVAVGEGDYEQAVRLLRVAEALRESIGAPLPPSYHSQYERIMGASRAALREEAHAAAWARGQPVTVEQAVTYALGLVVSHADVEV